MRNMNVCVLLQLVLNQFIANGNHQRLLCSSPKSNEREFTVKSRRLLLALCISASISWGVENPVPLEGTGVHKKIKIENKRELCHLPCYLRPSTFPEERFQSCLLGGVFLLVFLVSIQYLLDNTWIIKCGDISYVA